MKKSYKLKTGSCTDCTLYRECQKNKIEILRFLEVLGISDCGSGECVVIGEIESEE